MQAHWTMQEAQNSLPEVFRAARNGQPQFIYDNEYAGAVLVSTETWKEIAEAKARPSFKDMLFSIPKGEPFLDENRNTILNPRDVEF